MNMFYFFEVGVLLLDQKLVKKVLNLPERIKLNSYKVRSLLISAMKEELPEVIAERKDKRGFYFSFIFNEADGGKYC